MLTPVIIIKIKLFISLFLLLFKYLMLLNLEELSDMRKQMKALEDKNATYMQETMNLEAVW